MESFKHSNEALFRTWVLVDTMNHPLPSLHAGASIPSIQNIIVDKAMGISTRTYPHNPEWRRESLGFFIAAYRTLIRPVLFPEPPFKKRDFSSAQKVLFF
jgi:hypothetical protein